MKKYGRKPIVLRSPLGFTPEQEQALLDQETQEKAALDELLEAKRSQDQFRTFQAVAIIGGCLFTLARLGEFVADMRRKRTSIEGTARAAAKEL